MGIDTTRTQQGKHKAEMCSSPSGTFDGYERVGSMKTLNEVIETAPYIGTEWTNDALHYLKEYRDVLHTHIYIPEGYTQPKIGDKNR